MTSDTPTRHLSVCRPAPAFNSEMLLREMLDLLHHRLPLLSSDDPGRNGLVRTEATLAKNLGVKRLALISNGAGKGVS
jgi:hypothetical protein